MNSQDFDAIILAYKKFKNAIKTKECDNLPSNQECIAAYTLETELIFLGIGLLAAAAQQSGKSFYTIFPENIELVSQFTKEQVIAACNLVANTKVNEVKDYLSRMREFN